MNCRKLPLEYYLNDDVVAISKDLLGKVLVTHIDGITTKGCIIEVESYKGPEDRASHAYNMRRTLRNEVMYHEGGIAYVYICYGMHHLFNIVTNKKEIPHAILLRSIYPLIGIEHMLKRRNLVKTDKKLAIGPSNAAKCLGISKAHNGYSLITSDCIWLENIGIQFHESEIQSNERIGIDYAGPDAKLLWRFFVSSDCMKNKL